MNKEKSYIAIDLKSFYASVECIERHLDPMTANLVVADSSRTEKTICLAVTPALKAYGISGRARLFEVVQKVREVNASRLRYAPGHVFNGESFDDAQLKAKPELKLNFVIAPPRMAHYMQYSSRIYNIYLKYVAPEDIHVYSIDEVFIDATDYLSACKLTAREFAEKIVQDVLDTTGITATVGIGTNLYLCKIAMDIVAKHISPCKNGVRIAELDETKYRHELWEHRPLTDFWRIGRGYAKKLEQHGLYTMGDIARCSIGSADNYYNEELLYRLFGINAELLIDHAWGWEPCTIADIRAYRPENNSISSGQVLQQPYDFEKAKLVAREMTDLLVLDLVEKALVTDQMILTVCYDIENLSSPARSSAYKGEVSTDSYGRKVPKNAHGSINLDFYTSSTRRINDAVMALFNRIVDKNLLVRRIYIVANHVINEENIPEDSAFEQLDMFTDYSNDVQEKAGKDSLKRERRMQEAVIGIKKKYGKNSILKGMNLQEGATAAERNRQIGGHKA